MNFEKHPWLKTYTIISLMYWIAFGVFGIMIIFYLIQNNAKLVEILLTFLILPLVYVGISFGLYILRDTHQFREWTLWKQSHKNLRFLVYFYMYPGALLTIFFLSVPMVIYSAIKQSFRD